MSGEDSSDWRWQLKNAVRTREQLSNYLKLLPEEEKGLLRLSQGKELPLQITPHFMGLIDPNDPNDPLRLQVVPRASEFEPEPMARRDPLGEEDHETLPHLVHRYPDRVLLLITDRCASYCRFCTRKRWVGQGPTPKKDHITNALNYIRDRPEIKEVILSGGDALLWDDERLFDLLERIRDITSIEIIRIATRVLTFAPMRITDSFVQKLKVFQPVYIMSHINHPGELDRLSEQALLKLTDAGLPVLNQTVLLKNINDQPSILAELFRTLVRLRARPYYLHQCDLATGTKEFRVPLQTALNIVESLRGHISGLCMPQFVIDIPGGLGKVPLVPNPIVSQTESNILLRGFKGQTAEYPIN